jgi:hypothetical protein
VAGSQSFIFNSFMEEGWKLYTASDRIFYFEMDEKSGSSWQPLEHIHRTNHQLQPSLSGMSEWFAVFLQTNRNAGEKPV